MMDGLVWCRFIHFAAVLTVFGLCAMRPLLLEQRAWGRKEARGFSVLAVLALISALAWLLLTVQAMAGELSFPAVWLIVSETFFGQAWSLHLMCCAALLGIASMGLPRGQWLPALMTGAAVISLAPIGHGAMLEGWQGQLLMLNQAVHMLCAGAWTGGLLLLLCALARSHRCDPLGLLQRFSGVGYWLVAGLVLTGIINVRTLAEGFWPSPALQGYGLVLAIKLGLVLLMLCFALANRLALALGIERRTALRVSVGLEWAMGMGAMGAVALLGTLAPVSQ